MPRHRSTDDELSFVMVLQEDTPRNLPDAKPQQPLGPISHLGFALASGEEVDALAVLAKKDALLKFGPTFLNPYAGYLCVISDPDGHMVEFSHGQAAGAKPEVVNALNRQEVLEAVQRAQPDVIIHQLTADSSQLQPKAF